MARAFKNRDPKSSKKSSPEGQHEPQERLRRSQERPKRSQDDPKSALRAARSAPRGAQEQPGAHQKGPKRAPGLPRSAKKPPGEFPGPILASFLGTGSSFETIYPPRRAFHSAELKKHRFLRGSALSKPLWDHLDLPEARNHTKMLFEITCQKVLRDSCGTEVLKDHG